MRKVRPRLPADALSDRSPARERRDRTVGAVRRTLAAQRPTARSPARESRDLNVLAILASATTALLTGCATAGPLHVYSIDNNIAVQTRTSVAPPAVIRDIGPNAAADVPSFLHPDETLTGFAYDPYTDHFFLRLAPGNRFRVIDRPARAIKREFTVAALDAQGGGDLAIRPRDGHVFVLEPAQRSIAEITRFGEFVRQIPLEGLRADPGGVAYDPIRDRLFVLSGSAPAEVTSHTLDGKLNDRVPLSSKLPPSSLGYDPDKQEFYIPMPDQDAIGVFSAQGQLLRTTPARAAFVDVGPRSFVRVF